jgi:DNA-3-methyladenine glycosylase
MTDMVQKVLKPEFYVRNTVIVAQQLLGKVLRVKDGLIWRSGIIVEDEAYLQDDPSCHSFRGPNRRNQSMFKEPGTIYVFSIHRVHCINVVTLNGEAVLLRALQPLENVSLPTNGPGRLCRALSITRVRHDGLKSDGSEIQIADCAFPRFQIGVSTRIGLSKAKDLLLRFYVKDNPFLSRKK